MYVQTDLDVVRMDDSACNKWSCTFLRKEVLFTSSIGVMNVESKSQINNKDKFMKRLKFSVGNVD